MKSKSESKIKIKSKSKSKSKSNRKTEMDSDGAREGGIQRIIKTQRNTIINNKSIQLLKVCI